MALFSLFVEFAYGPAHYTRTSFIIILRAGESRPSGGIKHRNLIYNMKLPPTRGNGEGALHSGAYFGCIESCLMHSTGINGACLWEACVSGVDIYGGMNVGFFPYSSHNNTLNIHSITDRV